MKNKVYIHNETEACIIESTTAFVAFERKAKQWECMRTVWFHFYHFVAILKAHYTRLNAAQIQAIFDRTSLHIAHCTLHTFYARKQFEFGGKNGMFQELSLHSTEYSSEEETRLNQIDSGKINDWPVFRSNISILNHITQFTVCRFNQVYSQFHQKHSVLCIENICVLSFFLFLFICSGQLELIIQLLRHIKNAIIHVISFYEEKIIHWTWNWINFIIKCLLLDTKKIKYKTKPNKARRSFQCSLSILINRCRCIDKYIVLGF